VTKTYRITVSTHDLIAGTAQGLQQRLVGSLDTETWPEDEYLVGQAVNELLQFVAQLYPPLGRIIAAVGRLRKRMWQYLQSLTSVFNGPSSIITEPGHKLK